MLLSFLKEILSKRKTDRHSAMMQTIGGLVFLGLWLLLKSDTALLFGILWLVLAVFYLARSSFGFERGDSESASLDQARQAEYVRVLAWAAICVYMLYRGTVFAMNGKPEGAGIRFVLAVLFAVVPCFHTVLPRKKFDRKDVVDFARNPNHH